MVQVQARERQPQEQGITRRTDRRESVWLLLLAFVVTLGGIVLAGPRQIADAAGPVYTVVDSDNDPYSGIYLRDGTSMSNVRRVSGRYMLYGTSVELICGAWGEAVGPFANRRWHQVRVSSPSGGAPTGATGWIADRYLNTPNKANELTPGEAECGAAPTPVNPFFNRTATLTWALTHARDTQTVDSMCTWFASNMLWAGGFPKSAAWTDAGSHGTWPRSRPGTVAAWAVPEFRAYIQANFSTQWKDLGLLSSSNNAVPLAEPGDLIFYDWGHGAGISHVAVVVEIAPGQYPVVAEWGNSPYTITPARNFASPYQKRGWTWSENSGTWLQAAQGGGVRAYLLHINGGSYIPSF